MQKKNNKKQVKKQWTLKSKEGNKLEFFPVFGVSEESGEVETQFLQIKSRENGKDKTMTFNWMDIYMFVYFVCNEELRQALAQRYERKINYIPYDVTLRLTDEEVQKKLAHRRVELEVDELTMAIARNEAMKLLHREKDPQALIKRIYEEERNKKKRL